LPEGGHSAEYQAVFQAGIQQLLGLAGAAPPPPPPNTPSTVPRVSTTVTHCPTTVPSRSDAALLAGVNVISETCLEAAPLYHEPTTR
ncbi:hypothetical protein PENTCL1PPCAC_10601, partial [Pristionchus entomophagus]